MRFSIKLKLSLAFTLMTALLLGIAAYSSLSLGSLDRASSGMVDGPVRLLELALNADIAELDALRAQKNALLVPDRAQALKFFEEGRADLEHMLKYLQEGQSVAPIAEKIRWEKLLAQGATFRTESGKLEELY